jgi:hypothetical protein
MTDTPTNKEQTGKSVTDGGVVADGGDNDTDTDLFSIGDVFVRRSADATYPARVEVVADEETFADYRVEIYNAHDRRVGTQHPSSPHSRGAAGVSIAEIKHGIHEGHLHRTERHPGELPLDTTERVAAFLDATRVTIDADGVAYDSSLFRRWQKHGHDRLYVRDPGTGYVDIDHDRGVRVGEALVHPEEPVLHLGGLDHDIAEPVTDDGAWVVFGHDGASAHWPVCVVPDAEVDR